MYKKTCRGCNSTNLEMVLDLGKSPLANNLLDSKDSEHNLYPLELMYCKDCHNCQLSYTVPADEMFKHYLYLSSTTSTLRNHFAEAGNKYISKYGLDSDSLVVDIGSNDGVALTPLKEKGIRVLGVEPAVNVAKIAEENGITTINNYFNDDVVEQINEIYGKVDVLTASNMFAHSDFLESITKNVFRVLKQDGTFVVEVQYLLDTLRDLTFDNIYHEHVNYWSVMSISSFFERLGFCVVDVEHIDTHGGSIRVYIERDDTNKTENVDKFITEEVEYGLDTIECYEAFAKRVNNAKETFLRNIKVIKDSGETVVGYGSPAKATTTLNYFGVTSDDINYIIEDNKLKWNKYLPGVIIPIKSKDFDKLPDNIIIMAWNYDKEIRNNNLDLIEKGVIFTNIKELQYE